MNTKTNIRAGILNFASPQTVNQINAASVTTNTAAVALLGSATATSNVRTPQSNSAVVIS